MAGAVLDSDVRGVVMTAGIGAADAAIYTGVCLENNDPMNLGRIKYCVPQLSGEAAFGWAAPVTPGVTDIGSNVYVAFEGGDRNHPLFWPKNLPPDPDPDPDPTPPPTMYATFSDLEADYPSGATLGDTFWVTEYGGSVQWQGFWKWLPNGFQASYQAHPTQITVDTTNAKLLTSVSFTNLSSHRIYQFTADTLVSSTDTNTVSCGYALLVSTSALPATIVRSTTFDYQIYGNAPSNAVPSLWLTMATSFTGKTSGTLYVGTYLVNWSSNSANHIFSAATFPMNLVVNDIGAA